MNYGYVIAFMAGAIIALLFALYAVGSYRCLYEEKFHDVRHEKIRFSDYRPKSGDIIYRTRMVGRPIVQYAVDNYFDHYSIVVVKDGKYYMLDINSVGSYYDCSTNKVTLIPIEYIKESNDTYFVADSLPELTHGQNEKILSINNYVYPSTFMNALKLFFRRPTDPNCEYQNCLDLVAIALDKAGIVDIKHFPIAEKAKYLSTKMGPIKQFI